MKSCFFRGPSIARLVFGLTTICVVATAGPAGAVCGDGTVDGVEDCDDGNAFEWDACLSSCLLPSCGDGFVQIELESSVDAPLSAPDEGSNAGSFGADLVSQERFAEVDLPGLHAGDRIVGLALRLDGGSASYPVGNGVGFARFDISLGTPSGPLTSTLADNFDGAPVVVRSGALTWDAGDWTEATAGTAPFGPAIDFDAPYAYTGGDLLLEVRSSNPGESLTIDATSGVQTSGESTFAVGDADATTATTVVFNDNWVVRFRIERGMLEVCDDGNGIDSDTCTLSCLLPDCGDGTVQTESASSVDTPLGATAEGGNSGTFDSPLVSQERLAEVDLAGLHAGDRIVGFALRLKGDASSYPVANGVGFTRFDISIGTSSGPLTATLADNFDGAPVLTRSGALVWDAGDWPAATTGTAPYGPTIDLDSPYDYTGGDLSIEVRSSAPGENLIIDAPSDDQTNGESIFAVGDADANTATTGSFDVNWAIRLLIERGAVEDCDDGNAVESDACLSSCLLPDCGDGFVQTDLASSVDAPIAAGEEGATAGIYGDALVSHERFVEADLPGLNVGDRIVGFALRLDQSASSYPAGNGVGFTRYDISLGASSGPVTATLADNFDGAPTLVRSGTLVWNAGDWPAATTGVAPFGPTIDFDSPYEYTGGDLLLEVRSSNPGESLLIDSTTGDQTSGESIFAIGDADATMATAGPFGDNWALHFVIERGAAEDCDDGPSGSATCSVSCETIDVGPDPAGDSAPDAGADDGGTDPDLDATTDSADTDAAPDDLDGSVDGDFPTGAERPDGTGDDGCNCGTGATAPLHLPSLLGFLLLFCWINRPRLLRLITRIEE